ncbi:hypothetical protein ACFWWS_36875 [Streptomyces sp. NPDC059083]|uniref:hypothetical protein n=1 Tax=Streptomyces sp. NPDC059083 TaxID=3346721 RepID=UPI0036CBF724
MADPAKHIVIDHERAMLIIDGTEFPWLIADNGPVPSVEPGNSLSRVTLTLLADRVEVVSMPKLPAPAGRDERGDIRTFEGNGTLIARRSDTRADVQGWRDISTNPRFIAMYDAALAVFDAEAVANG